MSDTGSATVQTICRYPVKGLSPEFLETVACKSGETLPYDRVYAIENGPSRFDPQNPKHLPKTSFLMLMRDERLATLETRFDAVSQTLTVLRGGKQVATGRLDEPTGRRIIEQFYSAYMNFSLRGAPKLVSAVGHSFSDMPAKCVHIINLETIRDLERSTGKSIDPLRFRANIYVDGMEPWSEFGWIDRSLSIGDAGFTVFARTKRCDATNVNPRKGVRDMNLPTLIQRNWGHSDFGIYAKVSSDGQIRTGDSITVEA
ncbi:MAG: MOSC domain-containing protein [Hyphomicrobiaceae bacterium]